MSYQFKPSLLVSSFFLILILGLLSLGSWQLNRAADKQSLETIIDQRSVLEPISLNMPLEEFAPYQFVHATGQYRTKDSILLDNIVYQGKLGYYLITPFEIIASRAVILVNRGWIPQTSSTEDLPLFKTPEGLVTIEGHLSHHQSESVAIENTASPLSPTPPLWYYMDQDFFSQINGYPVLPLMLNLKADGQTRTFHSTLIPLEETETSLIQDWPNYESNSDEYFAYSILWFVFALFVFIFYIGLSVKKNKKSDINKLRE